MPHSFFANNYEERFADTPRDAMAMYDSGGGGGGGGGGGESPGNTKARRRANRRKLVGLPPTGFVFCSFNQLYKIDLQIFSLWMRLLRRTSHLNSVLWLLQTESATAAMPRIAAEMTRQGKNHPFLLFLFALRLTRDDAARRGAVETYIHKAGRGTPLSLPLSLSLSLSIRLELTLFAFI